MPGLTTDAEVCNQAMILLGAQRVNSLAAPANQRERDLASVYAQVRDSELRKNKWCFAQVEEEIDKDATYTPPTDSQWAVRYQLPALCLRAHLPASGFAVRGRYVYSTYGDDTILLQYTKSIVTVAEWDLNFIDAVAARIAYVMAEQVTQGAQKRLLAKDHYSDAIREARRSNAIERQYDTQTSEGWDWVDING